MTTEEIQDKLQQVVELMAAENYEAAKELAQSVLEADKRNYDAYMHLGNACMNLEQIAEGIEAFQKALMLQPTSTDALYSLACSHFLNGDNVEAVKYFNKCEDAGFVSVEMYSILEAIFLDANDTTQALRYANRAIQLEPLNPQPYVDKAQLYVMQGKHQEAVSCLREVEELLPDAGDPYLVESDIFLQTGEHERALEVLDRAVERFPLDAGMLLARARVLNAQEQYAEALETLAKARELSSDNEAAKRQIAMLEGTAQLGLGNTDASVAALEGSVDGSAEDADALFLLLNECYSLEDYERTLKFAEQMLALDGVEPRYTAAATFWQASATAKLGQEDTARSLYKKATSTLRQVNIGNPGLLEVYVYRALCHAELGEFEQALDLAEHVVRMAPESPAGHSFKAQVLEKSGDAQGAQEARAKVHELDPDFED